MLDEIDGDEFECNIHFLADFDCFFECEVVGVDGLCIVLIVVVELCFLEKCVSDFSLAEVLFCVFYFFCSFGIDSFFIKKVLSSKIWIMDSDILRNILRNILFLIIRI